MQKLARSIQVEDNLKVSSEWLIPDTYDGDTAIAIAHGAGNDMHSPFLVFIHGALARLGMLTVRFNFPYKEQGKKIPDRTPRLMQAWRGVIGAIQNDPIYIPRRLILAGKSLGGRMASMIAADGLNIQGLVFFGYPLHPARQPEKLRTKHLKHIDCPMLFIQGDRDPLCDLDLLGLTLKQLTTETQLHVVQGGDHSYRVLKKYKRSEQEVWQEVVEVVGKWIKDRG